MTEPADNPTLPAALSAASSADPESRVGNLIAGRYRLTRLLGSGGMGDVYLAEHITLRHQVAIKYMRPSIAADPSSSGRFMREAQALSLLRHPHIVAVHDFGKSGEDLYLAMEFLDGRPLSSWLERMLPQLPPVEQVIAILDQALDALDFAHNQGIIHRDIKPDNLFLTTHNNELVLKLVDFGLAHIDASIDRVGKLTSTGMIAGTPLYMSPEQCRSLAVGPGSDLYSMGCVLTELLQGTPPFQAASPAELMAQHMFMPVPSLKRPQGAPEVPPLLEKLRVDLLAKRAEKRPQSAAFVRNRLREAADPRRNSSMIPGRQSGEPSVRASRLPQWENAPPPSAAPSSLAQPARVAWFRLGASPLASPEDLSLALASQGLHVEPAPSEAALLASPAEALVLDAGSDLAAATRLLSRLQSTPFARRTVVCIEQPDMGAINQLVAAGAAEVMPPPILPESLSKKLIRTLRRKR